MHRNVDGIIFGISSILKYSQVKNFQHLKEKNISKIVSVASASASAAATAQFTAHSSK